MQGNETAALPVLVTRKRGMRVWRASIHVCVNCGNKTLCDGVMDTINKFVLVCVHRPG